MKLVDTLDLKSRTSNVQSGSVPPDKLP
jgi:hypothetical protein